MAVVEIILVGEPEQNTINRDATFRVAAREGQEWPEGMLLIYSLDKSSGQVELSGTEDAVISYQSLSEGSHNWVCKGINGDEETEDSIEVSWDIINEGE